MKIASEGYPFALGFAAVGFVLFFSHHAAADAARWDFFVYAAFCLFFFRDPERSPENDPRFVLSPGDGSVMEVAEETNPDFSGKAKVVQKYDKAEYNFRRARFGFTGTCVDIQFNRDQAGFDTMVKETAAEDYFS